jgi:biotin carboxyl carrier protein
MSAQPSHPPMDDERIELPEPGPVSEPEPEPDPEDEHPHHEQTGSLGESVGLGMRLVVSPAAGRLRLLPAARFHDGQEWVSAGQPIAEVENGPVMSPVVAPHEAKVSGILVRDGEPVLRGQPLVWLDETARRTRGGSEGGEE